MSTTAIVIETLLMYLTSLIWVGLLLTGLVPMEFAIFTAPVWVTYFVVWQRRIEESSR